MTQKLKVGIAGFGMIGTVHAGYIPYKCGDLTDLVAIADPDRDTLERGLEKTVSYLSKKIDFFDASSFRRGIRTYKDYEDMLKKQDIDVMHVCLPHNMHKFAAEYAILKAKSVIVEKPLAMDEYQAKWLVVHANNMGGNLGFISQNRYNSEIYWLRDKIKELGGPLGIEIIVDWYRDTDYYNSNGGWRKKHNSAFGGVLTNQGYHQLDLALWLLDYEGLEDLEIEDKKNIIDTKFHPDIEVENKVSGRIVFKDKNKFIDYYITTCNPQKRDLTKLKVHLTKNRYIELINIDGNLSVDSNFLSQNEITYVQEEDNAFVGRPSYGFGHKDNIRQIYLSILNKKIRPLVNPVDGINVLKVTDLILYPKKYREESRA